METLLEPWLVTARSNTSSPSKSPTATVTGASPTVTGDSVGSSVKVPLSSPKSMETSSERKLATARSKKSSVGGGVGGVGGIGSFITPLLLLDIHTTLESLSEPDGPPPSLSEELAPTSPSSDACTPLNPLLFTLVLLHSIISSTLELSLY